MLTHRLASAQTPQVPLGQAEGYGLLAGGTVTTTSPVLIIPTAGATGAIPAGIRATGTINANGTGSVPQALAAVQAARAYCAALPAQQSLAPSLGGLTLTEGVYQTGAAVSLATGSTPTLTGDSSSVFVFNLGAGLTIGTRAAVRLLGVRPSNVFWNTSGAFVAQTGAQFSGVLMTRGPVSFQGEHDGTASILTTGSVQLTGDEAPAGLGEFWAASDLRTLNAAAPGPCTTSDDCGTLNIVQNGSFETITQCPSRLGQIEGFTTPSLASCWFGTGSPDLFSTCAPFLANPSVSVPLNLFNAPIGSQHPQSAITGTNYAGVYSRRSNSQDQREYLMQELSAPLTAGRLYYGEFYVRLAPVSTQVAQHMQLAFTSARPTTNTGALLNYPVAISRGGLPAGANITWTQVGGYFTANGTERVLAIGNFVPNDLVNGGPARQQQQGLGGNGFPVQGAYYYVEDVSIVALPTAGPSVTISCGGQAQLGACPLPVTSGATYSWSPTAGLSNASIANPVASPTQTTTYTLTVNANGRIYQSSATVTVLGNAGNNQSIVCGGQATLGSCATAGASYAWLASPSDPSLTAATTANPVVSPAQTTTYTLFLIVNGQTFTSSTTVAVTNGPCAPPTACPRTYAQRAGATYDAARHMPAGNAFGAADIGVSNQITTLDASSYSGRVIVFDGVYHVRGSLELINGTFELRPNTVFYVEADQNPLLGAECNVDLLDSDDTRIRVSRDATLLMRGATLTAACQRQWGGVILVNKGTLDTEGVRIGPKQTKACEISQAVVGVLTGQACDQGGTYYIRRTRFLNDTYGFYNLGNVSPRQTGEGVVQCTFSSDPAARLQPAAGTFTQAGLTLRGANHAGADYVGNSFESVYVGAEVSGDDVVLDGSFSSRAYGAAIRVGAPNTGIGAPLKVTGSNIVVPAAALTQGQVVSTQPVYGIQVLPAVAGGPELRLEGNTIQGEDDPSGQKQQIGIYGHLASGSTFIDHQNKIWKLDEGIRLQDASAGAVQKLVVADNQLASMPRGVVLTGQQFAVPNPAVACNFFEGTDYAIYVEPSADVTELNSAEAPGGNNFAGGVNFSVVNDGNNNLDYYAFPQENVLTSGLNPPFVVPSPGGKPCSQRDYGYTNGVNRLALPTAVDLNDWLVKIRLRQGTPQQLRRYEQLVVRYYQQTQQLGQLETYVGTLPLLNAEAFSRFSLYLMENYRRAGQRPAAQRIRQALLLYQGQNPAIANRVAYFDIAERLATLRPGAKPLAADSLALTAIASSGTGYAAVACAALRYYYPTCGCAGAATRGTAFSNNAARNTLAATKPEAKAPKTALLEVYPNPASEQVQVQVRIATTKRSAPGAPLHLEVTAVANGRLVLSRPVTADEPAVVEVKALAPGLYLGRVLTTTGIVVATGKIVVVR